MNDTMILDGARQRRVDLAGAAWTKSSFSNGGTNCVEVAFVDGMVAIRDSKSPDQPAFVFTSGEYDAFLDGIADGELRRP
ncbi:DUF397 domain-containing protein [Allostreptomyces psammosilenae]|uniref:DUF397 domain-containing protein n=1 Tax=Allostreptomyces psammosilenae TaxID=1892865 RepID=A0A852ZTG9_9ACTN|nr:DUF397 domain-containing protein [Allostreptomyces psammosilenae]NYI05145.1 hypothetical protein [Allostreptomyces psammosilenae]